MANEPTFVDTNVILRLLRDDSPVPARAARQLFDAAANGEIALAIAATTFSEVVFVLRGRNLGYTRADAVAALRQILELAVLVLDRDVIEPAVEMYAREHDDWDDCLLAAYAIRRGCGVIASFDRGLDRIREITRIEGQPTGQG